MYLYKKQLYGETMLQICQWMGLSMIKYPNFNLNNNSQIIGVLHHELLFLLAKIKTRKHEKLVPSLNDQTSQVVHIT